MAISWISAMKLVPWGDVIEAAPGLVKGARKVFSRTQAIESPALPDAGLPPQLRFEQLEASVARLARDQQETAALLESLAEHHAKVVEAVELLRRRGRALMLLCIASWVGLLALAAWVMR